MCDVRARTSQQNPLAVRRGFLATNKRTTPAQKKRRRGWYYPYRQVCVDGCCCSQGCGCVRCCPLARCPPLPCFAPCLPRRRPFPYRGMASQRERAEQLLQVVDDRLRTWRPLEDFCGSQLIPEDQKWHTHTELTEELAADPESIKLLGDRAIVRLQCGIPFHAYSDCERLRYSLFRTPAQAMVSAPLIVSLLALLSFLEMKMNHELIANELANFFTAHYLLTKDSTLSDTFNPIVASGASIREVRLQLISAFGEALTMDTKSFDGKIMTLLHALLQSIEVGEREKEEMFDASPERMRLGLVERMQMMSGISVSNSPLPMQYRSGPGGGRNPEFVQRTLFAQRKEATQNVEIVPDPEKGGFKMVAKRDITASETFLKEEPIVSLSTTTIPVKECALCMKPLLSRAAERAVVAASAESLTCRGCGERYCSTECQEKSWKQYHSLLCDSGWNAFLEVLNLPNAKSSLPDTVCKAIKLILMGVSRGLSPLQWPELQVLHRITDSPTPINPANVPTTTCPAVDKVIGIYNVFRSKCASLAHHVHLEDLLELVNVMNRNAMGAVDMGYSALYCVGSFANHDCSPNAEYDGRPPRLAFRALRDIVKGEEITISYVNINEDQKMRNLKLDFFYGFKCRCLRCRLEEGLGE